MKGSEALMLNFMEGADKRYVIPVYQRKYDWKNENCRQLYDDLKRIVIDNRSSHFFGSLVSSVVPNGNKIEYHIIDGQQRLTTVSLLLLAICNLVEQGKVAEREDNLNEQIKQRFLISPWAREDDKIKLRPVKDDQDALIKLYGNEEDFDYSSNLTLNYQFFCDMILKEEVTIDDLFAAIGKLEIISITLDPGDNAQMIFESLNSTGLALEEGDKIRNYVLMGLQPKEQNHIYNNYWSKIERLTDRDVSGFVRDYLSIKQQIIPTINKVYKAFKIYAENVNMPIEPLMDDILKYARFFGKLRTCKSDLNDQVLDDCLYRMARLEIVVTRPFLMEVLRLKQDGKLTTEDVEQIFLITEAYLFRRNICEVPTNALNKIFLNLNKEILRYDNTANDYVQKFIYTLLSKKENARFPNDEEFITALAEKQVYKMRGKYKAYLFERFENYGTIETKDVYTHLDNNIYSIEHIMPQHLSPPWIDALGDNAEEIHEEWLHRLANLTLTGYNPNLSNKPFEEKRDAEEGGYRVSGLKMNQKIAMKDSWGLTELEERNDEMVAYAKKIWAYPQTDFIPAEREYDSCTLDDEGIDLTGRDIIKYSYQNIEQPVNSWAEMFEHIVKYLHQKDKSVLTGLAYSSENVDLGNYVRTSEEGFRKALKIDENIYVEINTSTAMKMSMLRRLFSLYEADQMDLVFYLRDVDNEKEAKASRYELRKRFWTYAVPIMQEENLHRGIFNNAVPVVSNTVCGYFGLSGISVACVANYNEAIQKLEIYTSDYEQNKALFDMLYNHKAEIEQKLGVALTWDRAEDRKGSWISYQINNVGITNEIDWPRIAKFFAEWSGKFSDVFLPYMQGEEDHRFSDVAGYFREWAYNKEGVHVRLDKCSRSYTRFTTDEMTELLPDLEDAPSGWNTDNHYFYEIFNQRGEVAYIQLAFSAKNMTEEQREVCEKINKYYPATSIKENWQWRIAFKTNRIDLSELSREHLYPQLDECLAEIKAFENDLINKLQVDEFSGE